MSYNDTDGDYDPCSGDDSGQNVGGMSVVPIEPTLTVDDCEGRYNPTTNEVECIYCGDNM